MEEVSHVTTSSYVLLAALVAYLAFGRDIAVLSVCFLAVGDVAAGIVGWHMGRTRLFGKALEGDLACLVSCLATGFLLHYAGLNVGLVTITAGALGATIGQAISGPVDDNLTLPLLAGVAMAAVPP
jgi:dolichol kinase